MGHTPQQAYAFALQTLAGLGGIPPDAQPAWTGSMTAQNLQNKTAIAVEDVFEWKPRNDLASQEWISVGVAERRDGSLYASAIVRHWYPAWWREFEQWSIRNHALPIPAPAIVRDSCAHGVDRDAIARVLGSPLRRLMYGGIGWPAPAPLAASAAVETAWSRPVTLPAVDYGGADSAPRLPVRVARISDVQERPVPKYRIVMLLTLPAFDRGNHKQWRWVSFGADDVEHVCL